MAKRLPLIVMFDLDGTLVGNSEPFTDTWEVHDNYARVCRSDASLTCDTFDTDEFLDSLLRGGLMRPHVARALSAIRKYGAHPFVFSMVRKWLGGSNASRG